MHKKYPDILTASMLQSFSSAADFAKFLESPGLLIRLEQNGMIFEQIQYKRILKPSADPLEVQADLLEVQAVLLKTQANPLKTQADLLLVQADLLKTQADPLLVQVDPLKSSSRFAKP